MCKNTTMTGAVCEFCDSTPEEKAHVLLNGGGDSLAPAELLCEGCMRTAQRQCNEWEMQEGEVKLPEGVDLQAVAIHNGEWMPKLDGQAFETKCEACGGVTELRGGVRPRFCPFCGSTIPKECAHQPTQYGDQVDLLNALGELLAKNPQEVIALLQERVGWRG